MRNVLAGFVKNTVLANIMMVTILLAGIVSAMLMVREEMPSVAFDEIKITVAFPGADPEEVEEGISRKIEEVLKGMEGLKIYTTVSMENMSETHIEINESYDGQEVYDRVRIAVESIDTFPIDSEKPIITLPNHTEPVMALYINGSYSEKALKEWAYRIKDQLLSLPEVSQVYLYGIKDYEITVEVAEQKLREYGISFSQVSEAIRRSNLNRSGGTIKDQAEEIRVRTVGRKYTDQELASIVVLANKNGDLITLDKIATIKDGFSDENTESKVNGRPAIVLSIFKTDAEDAIRISDSVKEYIANTQDLIPPGSSIDVLFDNSESIRHQVSILVKNGIMGMILVFIILWLFLNARLSLWTGVGILISVVGGLAIVYGLGETINMVSIFGFIMILGIVADDAIVVGESIAWHRKQGKGPIQAAIDGFMEVGLPVVTAVLTTIIAFIPLMFIEGVMGKIIRVLPVVVIACLVISLLESFALLPAHLSHLPDPNRAAKKENLFSRIFNFLPSLVSKQLDWFAETIYARLLNFILKGRYAFFSLTICILLISLGLVFGGFLKFELLPKRDGYYLTSVVEFPEGTSLNITKQAVEQMEAAFIKIGKETKTTTGEPLVKNILALSGQAPESEPGDYGPKGSHIGGVQIMLLDSQKRGIHSNTLLKMWKQEVGEIYGAKSLSFTGTIMGHPGKPIEIGVDGHDLEKLAIVSNSLKENLNKFNGVFDVQSDFVKGKDEIQFSLKPEARGLGITVQDLADQLYAGYFGEEVLAVQRGRDNIKIRVRYTETERNRINSLDNFRIRTNQGFEVPLSVVANTRIVSGSSTIIRRDGLRRITVTADIDAAVIKSAEVIEELNAGFIPQMAQRYPDIRIDLEGEAGEAETSFDAMFMGFFLAILAIYMLMATLFKSYLQPLIILFTIPFGLIGAIWGHFLLDWDLTMISMFGMIGLTGIVVNDAIVLIERINVNLKEGLPLWESIRQGGIRRFRAVFLTSITTVGGLAPLIFEADTYATIMIPMAITIVFGVIFATILTLLLIPSLLLILNDFRLLKERIKSGTWKNREAVEPAIAGIQITDTAKNKTLNLGVHPS